MPEDESNNGDVSSPPRKIFKDNLSTSYWSKRGPKIGSKNVGSKTVNDWYNACVAYRAQPSKTSIASFLRSHASGPKFSGSKSECVSLGQHLKQYDAGILVEPGAGHLKRRVSTKFEAVEKKLIKYIDLRAHHYKQDKCGVSWNLLRMKARQYADQLGIPADDFKASDGWLSKTLNRHGRVGINLHGEGATMDEKTRIEVINNWKETEFHPVVEEFDIPLARIYNADQTGLFYQKLPNHIYVDKQKKRDYFGAKEMKDKNRLTVMIASAADGSKVPLSIVGKPKNPKCFELCENPKKPPIAYFNQDNAYFTREVTAWWIKNVFLPHHNRKFGNAHAILLLDNCSAHKIDEEALPSYLHLIFFPPNMTSSHQPADMGMIASLKIGYKTVMLSKLLEIFDADGGYEGAAITRRTIKKGCRGLDYGGKATILDAMIILQDIWKVDSKYALESGIQRCWRKAGILPISMETEINIENGSNSLPLRDKTLSFEACYELCTLMKSLQVKAAGANLDLQHVATALNGSFVCEGPFKDSDFESMAQNWFDIEDQPEIEYVTFDEEVEAMEERVEEDAPVGNDNAEEEDSEPEDEWVLDPIDVDNDNEDGCFATLMELKEALYKMRISLSKLGVEESAVVHLDRFQKAVQKAGFAKKKKPTTIHDYFTPAKNKNN
jgi:hypothetical protein